MAKKKVKARKAFSPKKSKDWFSETQDSLNTLVKKSGASSAAMVFSANGDLIFRAGRKISADMTSIGALTSSLLVAGRTLGGFLGTASGPFEQGPAGKSFWAEETGDWIVLGVKTKRSAAWVKFFAHLKKKKASQVGAQHEALEGLTEAAVDAALEA